MYHQSVNKLAGFVLTGGKSTRMGCDKAFLPWGNGTLLSRALEVVGAVTADVRVVGAASKFAGKGTVVEDVYPDRGPLGGIHAALLSSSSELNLVLAVDLPLVEPRFLEYLLAKAKESGSVVTVPRAGGGFQPLCAIYRRGFAQLAEQALRGGKNKIDTLFARVKTLVIEEEELAHAGFSPAMFRNLNTPEELEVAKRDSNL